VQWNLPDNVNLLFIFCPDLLYLFARGQFFCFIEAVCFMEREIRDIHLFFDVAPRCLFLLKCTGAAADTLEHDLRFL